MVESLRPVEQPSQLSLPPQPKIGEKASPLASSSSEMVNKLQGMAADFLNTTVILGPSLVTLSATIFENQDALPGVVGPVPTRLDVIFTHDGFWQSVIHNRGEGSVVPSTERTFSYDSDGTVIKIEDTFVYPSGKRTVVARQTFVDGLSQTAYFPDDQEISTSIGSDFKTPNANVVIDMSPAVTDLLRIGQINPEASIQIIEQSDVHLVAMSHQVILVPAGEFVQTQGIELEKDAAGRWHPIKNTFSFLPATTDETAPLGTGAYRAEYTEDGYLQKGWSFIGGNLHVEETFHYTDFSLFDQASQPTGQSIRMFNISMEISDPYHPDTAKKHQSLDFIPYVFLRGTNTGKMANFGVAIEDQRITIDGVVYLQRTASLPDEKGILRANLALTGDGQIDQNQTVHLMLLKPNERRDH